MTAHREGKDRQYGVVNVQLGFEQGGRGRDARRSKPVQERMWFQGKDVRNLGACAGSKFCLEGTEYVLQVAWEGEAGR